MKDTIIYNIYSLQLPVKYPTPTLKSVSTTVYSHVDVLFSYLPVPPVLIILPTLPFVISLSTVVYSISPSWSVPWQFPLTTPFLRLIRHYEVALLPSESFE